ncbi:cyclic nucleotide-binding domain protein (macronuclear) [Tetrahymena thermophila SB210]|uniref:Cyclic nucleotide-binding domain protein n=1 Tax=Tetrahymena thermophila (strain SB210) TaxID=312017 RepID=Q22BB2_TETTS|nr:cyclic nucleotide-binding domain protein [Tetrahymena thermophila SB210]EAR82596.2 cyclic nucleotide-binding domain protein [Tetrahymena thermophila SB210]|eukprot:XP_001030259.2 cyclic nucleotide-binding domain protein [Tetrahymena thermophila SB210]
MQVLITQQVRNYIQIKLVDFSKQYQTNQVHYPKNLLIQITELLNFNSIKHLAKYQLKQDKSIQILDYTKMKSLSPDSKQLQYIIKLLQVDPEQRTNKMIQNLIKDDSYFPQLSNYLPQQEQEVKIQCLKYMRYEFFNANTAVFNIDEKGDKFYLILSGIVGVFIRKNKDDSALYKVKELSSGQGFGEMALISNKLRSASIICLSNVHLASIEKSKFNVVLKSLEQQKLQNNLIKLENIPYFSNWTEQQLKQIYYNSFKQEFHKNEKVFEENQEIDSVYIILEGEFMQSKHFRVFEKDFEGSKLNDLKKNFIVSDSQNNMKNIQLTIMQKNELFGEEDIIGQNDKRTFTVTCLSLRGEVLMIKQKDFQRLIMTENKSRQLIEKRLLMKNVVRNARVTSIAAQFDKQQYNKLMNQSPNMFRSNKNNLLNENKQTFEDEYSYYRSQTDQIQLNQEEEQNSLENQENQQQKNCQIDQNVSPKCNLKRKIQKDILVKGFQDHLKLNLIKKFNSLQFERLHNTVPKNLIENIEQVDDEIYKQMNLKQRHNNDIRLTDQQKQQYQRILIKRQAQEQLQNQQEQKTFTRLVQCTSHENLSSSQTLSTQTLGKGSSSSKNNKTSTSKYRFSTPENILRQPIQQETKSEPYFHFANYSYVNSNSARTVQHPKIKIKPTTAILNQDRMFISSTQTQTSSPLLKSSLHNTSPTVLTPNKSEIQFCRKENIRLKKCENLLTTSQFTQESEINSSNYEIQSTKQLRKINSQASFSKNILQIQQSYYNNFTNPYHKVIQQIKKKKMLEDQIKMMNLQQQQQYQINKN